MVVGAEAGWGVHPGRPGLGLCAAKNVKKVCWGVEASSRVGVDAWFLRRHVHVFSGYYGQQRGARACPRCIRGGVLFSCFYFHGERLASTESAGGAGGERAEGDRRGQPSSLVICAALSHRACLRPTASEDHSWPTRGILGFPARPNRFPPPTTARPHGSKILSSAFLHVPQSLTGPPQVDLADQTLFSSPLRPPPAPHIPLGLKLRAGHEA